MAALWEVKQHLVVHLAAHINDSSLCVCVCVRVGKRIHVCDTLSDYVSLPLGICACERLFHTAVHISVFGRVCVSQKRHASVPPQPCAARAHNCLFCRRSGVDEVNCESVSAPFEV